jgi:hypothetical protein
MAQIKAGIFSFFMRNIPQEAVEAQRKVVAKFNKSGYAHHQFLTEMRHGFSMDGAWHLNGVDVQPMFASKIPKKFDYDVMVFLDIDAVPLNADALDFYVEQAYNGALVGNIQRTNHIQNGQHTFVAPSAMAISTSTFLTIGRPSAIETSRSDVAEEYTWLCEKAGIKVIKFMPLAFEKAPDEAPQGWNLADGMPKYGLGTTFGDNSIVERPMMWHNFQVRLPGQPERFMRKCSELLNDGGANGEPVNVQQQTTEGHQATA